MSPFDFVETVDPTSLGAAETPLYPAYKEKGVVRGGSEEKKSTYWWLYSDVYRELPGLSLPGERCGHVKEVDYCGGDTEECTVDVKHLWCYRMRCKTCWNIGRMRTVDRETEYMKAYIELCNKNGIALRGLNYAIVSPPQEWGKDRQKTVGGIRYMKRVFHGIMKYLGAKAWKFVYHEFRVKKWAKVEFAKVKKSDPSLKGVGMWDWLRLNDMLDPGTDAIYFSPHFHVWYWGFLKPSKVLHTEKKWVYKKIAESLTLESFERRLNYTLSHVSIFYDMGDTTDKERRGSAIQVIGSGGSIRNMSKQEELKKDLSLCTCGNHKESCYGWEEYQEDSGDWWVKEQEPGEGLILSGDIALSFTRIVTYWLRSRPDVTVTYGNELEKIDRYQRNILNDYG